MKPTEVKVLLAAEDDADVATCAPVASCVVAHHARTQRAAREALASGAFDVCLLDCRLGGHRGVELMREAREERRRTLFVLLACAEDCAQIAEARSLGADDVLTPEELSAPLVARVVRHAAERAAARGTRRESEDRYRLLFESNPHPMWVYDLETLRFLDVNEAAVRQYGYTRNEFYSMKLTDIRPPEDVSQLLDFIEEGVPAHEESYWRHRRKDGSIIHIELISHELEIGGRRCRFALALDISLRVAAEDALRASNEQLMQSQRLESVGRLAGGVAHDFNNLLTAIIGYSDLSLRKLKADEPTHQYIGEVKKAASRAAALTRQLLAFSRKQVLQPKTMNLNEIVSEMGEMLRRLIGEDVEFVARLAPQLGSVHADPSQIEQVVINLVVNARDAMARGGKLTVTTENVHLDEQYAARHVGAQPGDYVMLAVSDTGTGMDAATQARIFEPFFTTKEKSKGTGLGLSTVYGIVKQSGGGIWVYSEVGAGTTFKVYLPRVAGATEDVPAGVVASSGALPRGRETVLLVEDEETVRGAAREILESCGYRVLEAACAEDAMKLSQDFEGEIEALVTDVVMPRMGGRELAKRLARLRPRMRVLYVSGYTDGSIVRHGILEADVAFLQKPFTPGALGRKLREVLEAA
jgi:two-component system cell cycle sensor histidine kinase/response regulator CckA